MLGAIEDMIRIARLKNFVIDSEGISLAVLACTDFVGNLTQAGLTIASAYNPAAEPRPHPSTGFSGAVAATGGTQVH